MRTDGVAGPRVVERRNVTVATPRPLSPSSTVTVVESTVMRGSSSRIVTVPTPSPTLAPTTFDRVTVKVSSFSGTVSPTIWNVTSAKLAPGWIVALTKPVIRSPGLVAVPAVAVARKVTSPSVEPLRVTRTVRPAVVAPGSVTAWSAMLSSGRAPSSLRMVTVVVLRSPSTAPAEGLERVTVKVSSASDT